MTGKAFPWVVEFDLYLGGVGKIEPLVSDFRRFFLFSGAEVVNYGGPHGTCRLMISFPASNFHV